MRNAVRTLVAAAALALTAGPAWAQKPDAEPKGKAEVLKTVISVEYAVAKSKPPILTITAVGQVPTGGWTGTRLTPRKADKAPADGVYEFDLTAVRPEGFVTQVISKVTATYEWKDPPADIKGVKVYGSGDGVKTVKFGEKK